MSFLWHLKIFLSLTSQFLHLHSQFLLYLEREDYIK